MPADERDPSVAASEDEELRDEEQRAEDAEKDGSEAAVEKRAEES